jgi:hypothetical protein
MQARKDKQLNLDTLKKLYQEQKRRERRLVALEDSESEPDEPDASWKNHLHSSEPPSKKRKSSKNLADNKHIKKELDSS